MLLDTYSQLMSLINAIDEKLDSLGDTKTAGKRAKTNELIENTKEHWEKVANNFVEQLSEAAPEILIGIYYGTIRSLQENLGKKADEALEAMLKDLPAPTPLITAEEVPALSENRSDLYQKVKAIIEIAQTMGDDDADKMVMPKKRTGSKGPRGKRALSYFVWFVDDKEFPGLTEVVALYPANYSKVVDLRKAIAETEYEDTVTDDAGNVSTVMKKYDLRTPPDRIEFTLPDGKILIGENRRPDDAPVVADADDDGDASDDSDDDGE